MQMNVIKILSSLTTANFNGSDYNPIESLKFHNLFDTPAVLVCITH